MIAQTSRLAYQSLDLTAGQRRVMLWFHKQPEGKDFTRAEIAQGSGTPLQTVCGRSHELVANGYLEELSARPCRVTGNPSKPLRIKTSATPPQSTLPVPPTGTIPRAAVAEPDELLVTSYDRKGRPFQYVAVCVK